MKVKTTTDYSKFKDLHGNRQVKIGHIQKLADSMRENNLLEYQPVLVNEEHYIIDGQHRLKAAEMLGVPVHYIVVPGVGLSEVQLLNATVKPWSLRDYAESFANLGYEDYQTLIDFADAYQFPIRESAALLQANEKRPIGDKDKGLAGIVKSGQFAVNNVPYAQEIAININRLSQYAAAPVRRHRRFIEAVAHVMSKIDDFDRLITKASERTLQPAINYAPSRNAYLLELDGLYNHGKSKKVNIF